MKGRSRLYPISIIMMAAFLAAGPAKAVYAVEPNGSWVNLDGNWYWKKTDGTAYIGWLYTGGRFYYMKEDGTMATGWEKVGDEWYYFHEDGGMNEGQLVLDNAVYEFESSGALKTAKWLENTGGGAYNAGCYDDVAQDLFGQLGDEKKEQYFDAYPDREREYDGDNHTSYDRYAGFIMDMKLNKIAQSRLEAAMEKGMQTDGLQEKEP